MITDSHGADILETASEKIDAEVNTNSFSKFFDDVLYKATGKKFKKERKRM